MAEIPYTYESPEGIYYVPLENRPLWFAEISLSDGPSVGRVLTPRGTMQVKSKPIPAEVLQDKSVSVSSYVAPVIPYPKGNYVDFRPLGIKVEIPYHLYLGDVHMEIPIDGSNQIFFRLIQELYLLPSRPFEKGWMRPIEWDGYVWYASPCLFRWRSALEDRMSKEEYDEGIIHPFIWDSERGMLQREDYSESRKVVEWGNLRAPYFRGGW